MFDEKHSRTGPRLLVGPLLSSVGIPQGPVSMFLTATNLEANASFACWISDAFFVKPLPFLAAIHTRTLIPRWVQLCAFTRVS